MGTALLFTSARRDDKPKIAGAVLMRQVLPRPRRYCGTTTWPRGT